MIKDRRSISNRSSSVSLPTQDHTSVSSTHWFTRTKPKEVQLRYSRSPTRTSPQAKKSVEYYATANKKSKMSISSGTSPQRPVKLNQQKTTIFSQNTKRGLKVQLDNKINKSTPQIADTKRVEEKKKTGSGGLISNDRRIGGKNLRFLKGKPNSDIPQLPSFY